MLAVLKVVKLNVSLVIDVMSLSDKLMSKNLADGKLKAPESIVDI